MSFKPTQLIPVYSDRDDYRKKILRTSDGHNKANDFIIEEGYTTPQPVTAFFNPITGIQDLENYKKTYPDTIVYGPFIQRYHKIPGTETTLGRRVLQKKAYDHLQKMKNNFKPSPISTPPVPELPIHGHGGPDTVSVVHLTALVMA